MSLSENWSRIDVARSREEKAEGLPHDSLEVVVRARAPHRAARAPSPGGSSTITFTHLDPELPGAKGLMLMSAIGPLELVPG